MILLTLSAHAPQQDIINLINEKPPAIVKVVEPTLQDKIKRNYYKCKTDIEYIRADNAHCLAKPVQTVSKTTEARKTVKSTQNSPVSVIGKSSTGLNGYTPGQCTAWVASQRYVPSGWGDASNWGYAARSAGWTVSSTPVANSIAWRSGHVAYVISVGDGTVLISEANYDYNGSIRTIEVPVASYQYIY